MKVLLMFVSVAVVAAVLVTNSFAEATNNLWRCTRCNGQIQTSDTAKPNAGSCPHGGGHDWVFVK